MTTKRTTLNFNGSFYEQTDGVGMGSPIAPAFADIFMNYVIEKTKEFNMQPDEFFRYVDDCFAVFPDFESAMLFYRKLNQIHSNVNLSTNLKTINSCPSWTSMLTIQKINYSYPFIENLHTLGCIISGVVWLPLNTK